MLVPAIPVLEKPESEDGVPDPPPATPLTVPVKRFAITNDDFEELALAAKK
jgi:hypothetical protein